MRAKTHNKYRQATPKNGAPAKGVRTTMKVELLQISSDQLEPSDTGYPENWENFDILIELDLCFENHQANSVYFEFYVASPIALSSRPTNSFMPPTLVLEEFDWKVIKSHINKLLSRVNDCQSWGEVAHKLNGLIRPYDISSIAW
jgi:hypothetical protein